MLKKASLFAIIVGFLCVSAHAQFWPLPDYTAPGVTKACSLCPDGNAGMQTPGWGDPLQRYVGRFVSSEYVGDFQQYYRTARAAGMHTTPDGSRVMIKLGNGIAAYDAASFIQRLDAHEAMVSVSTIPTNPSTTVGNRFGSYLEVFLNFEHFFYAEFTSSGWKIQPADGQDRLLDYDVDDRGYVYLAYGSFGFGIANDSAGLKLMPSVQDKTSLTWSPVGRVMWVKDGTDYYAFAGKIGDTFMHTFKVGSGNTPTATEGSQFPKAITAYARATGRTAIVDQNADAVYIYDNHNLVTGGQPLQTISYSGYHISHLYFDGTNFWAAGYTPGLAGVISKIAPSGNAYVHNEYPVGDGGGVSQPLSFRGAGQYLVLLTLDKQLRVYKTASGRPVETLVPSIPKYFANNGSGYAAPTAHMALWEVDPLLVGGKLYLVVSGDGIGDVYQMRTEDGVVPQVLGTVGPNLPNAPNRAATDYFYGDTLKFTAALSSGAGGNVNWNFGVSKDPNNSLASTFGTTVQHQYTGLVPADIASNIVVTATNPATSASTTLPINLKTPKARFAFGSASGAKSVVTLPGTNAPIVSDDVFVDASDGDTNGHYVDWRIAPDAASLPNTASNYQPSTASVGVGACGAHTLSMTSHYGYAAYSGANVDFPVTPGNFAYNVRAFAPAVDLTFNAGTSNIEFFSTSRAAAALSGRSFTYTWDVVDSANNNAPVAGITPVTGTVSSIDSIPRFPVSRSKFAGTSTYKGRLSITVSGADPCNPNNPTMPAQAVTTSALVAPDAVLTPVCNSGVCQYTVTSPSNVATSDAWTYSWSSQGGTPNTGTSSSLTITYTTIGDFPLSVVVTNKSGLSTTLPYTAHITVAANPCGTLIENNTIGITWQGTSNSTSCRDGSGTCTTSEPIQFSVYFYRYDSTCATQWNYSWSIDGSAPQSSETFSSTFFTAGQHTVKCVVTNNVGNSITLQRTISIGTNTPPPPPPPPPCGTMSAANTGIDYSSVTGTCKPGGTCKTGETVAFNVSFFGYDSTCATHTYRWAYDGVNGNTGQFGSHIFTTPGNHTVTCTISNGTQTNYVASASVNVQGTVVDPPTPPNPCATLQPNLNVFIDYTGTTPNCHVGGACSPNEQIAATVTYFGYNSDCGTHTYNWKVDGAPIGVTTKSATTTLPSGTHTLTCTVGNGNPTVDVSATVSVTIPATPTFQFDFTMTALPANVAPNSYVFSIPDALVTPLSAISDSTQWVWNFGDNSPEVTLTGTAGRLYTHTFPDNKEYTVTLRAVGNSLVVTHSTPAPAARRRSARH